MHWSVHVLPLSFTFQLHSSSTHCRWKDSWHMRNCLNGPNQTIWRKLKWIYTCPSWSWKKTMTLNPLWAAWGYEMLLTQVRLISQGCQWRRIFSSHKLFTKLLWKSMKKVRRQQLPQVSWWWDLESQQWLSKRTTLLSSLSDTTNQKPSSSLAGFAHPSQWVLALQSRRCLLASTEVNPKPEAFCNQGSRTWTPSSLDHTLWCSRHSFSNVSFLSWRDNHGSAMNWQMPCIPRAILAIIWIRPSWVALPLSLYISMAFLSLPPTALYKYISIYLSHSLHKYILSEYFSLP